MKILEYDGQRIMTTGQLAEICNVTADKINLQLSKNRSRLEDSGYRILKGSDLNRFKRELSLKTKAPSIGIWSADSAATMAVMLGNEKAQSIIRSYFLRLFPFHQRTTVTQNDIQGTMTADILINEIRAMKQNSEQSLIDEMKERIKLLEKIVAEKDTQIKDSTELQAALTAQNGQYLTIIQQLLSK